MKASKLFLTTIIMVMLFTIAIGCTSSSIELSSLPLSVQAALKSELRNPELEKIQQEELEAIESISIRGIGEGSLDLSIVGKMKSVSLLTLEDLDVESFDFLYELPNLSYLTLSETRVDHLPDFSKLNLHTVNLDGLRLESLEVLQDSKGLDTVIARRNQLVDFRGIEDKVNLMALMISDNPISDISPLGTFKDLHRLEIRNTKVKDLSPLSASNKLEILDIRNTDVESIAPIAQLPELKMLMLTKKNIKDLHLIPGHVEVSEQTILAY